MNIIQALLNLFNAPQLLEQLSRVLGESTATTQKGLGAVIPAILGGLVSKGATESGAGSLIKMINEYKIDAHVLDRVGNMFGGHSTDEHVDDGKSMLSGILGDKLGAIGNLVGSVSGMGSGAVGKLMALAAPLVLGGVAKAAPSGGFSTAGLMSVLSSQKQHLAEYAPPGLCSLFGLGNLEAKASAMATATHAAGSAHRGTAATASMAAAEGDRSILPWVLLAGLIGAAVFVGVRMSSSLRPGSSDAAPVAATDTAPAPAVPEPATPAPTTAEITLPSGAKFTVAPGSVGEKLFQFLTGPETGSKTFLFDGLTFDTGRASLDTNSQSTIVAIAGILKEFGAVNVSVDGYTDNKGSKNGNQRLSAQRARTVADALTAAGVATGRIAAAGHGDNNPVADNGTDEGRAQNRRTELTATK